MTTRNGGSRRRSQLIPRLVAIGVSVYAFDMWGSGQSPGRRGFTDVDDAVKDHQAALRALSATHRRVFVLAHSVGGLVAAASVAGDSSLVEGLILLAPALDWGIGPKAATLIRAMAVVAPSLPSPGGGAVAVRGGIQVIRRMQEDTLLVHGGASWATLASGLRVSRDSWRFVTQQSTPRRSLSTAPRDRTPDPRGSARFLSSIGARDTTLQLIEGAPHGLLDDTAGPRVAAVVLRWIG